MSQRVARPVWRSFRPRFVDEAARHVRRGGFAAVFQPNGDAKVLLPLGPDGKLTELAQWALLAIEVRRWGHAAGPARGLATVRLRGDDAEIVREWCERDGAHPRARHVISLDCRACGACCRDNHVVLERPDLRRWKAAARDDLAGRAYTKTARGKLVLRLAPGGRCVHLGAANACAIYPLRPDNCSAFPAGAEPCLAAREETLGLVD